MLRFNTMVGRAPRRRALARRCRPRLEGLEDRIDPATFNVADVTGLQAAIAAVNLNPTEQATIFLKQGTYDLMSELKIVNASNLTIQGDGADEVIIDNPTHTDRIFEIDGGAVTLSGVTDTGGHADGSGGGGILASSGTLTVDHSDITGNNADGSGGGGGILASGGTLIVDYSDITGNHADGNGIGIFETPIITHGTLAPRCRSSPAMAAASWPTAAR
jgi:hypothetical protein